MYAKLHARVLVRQRGATRFRWRGSRGQLRPSRRKR